MRTLKVSLLVAVILACFALVMANSVPNVPSNTWQATDSGSAARTGAAAVLLMDGRVLITGGTAGGAATASAEVYSAASGFSPVGSMLEAGSGHAAVVVQDGRVLVTGGDGGSGPSNSAEIYDPANDSWTPIGAMAAARSGHTATPLLDGSVLIAGGSGSSGLERYDVEGENFYNAGSLSQARSGHAADLLNDGRVIIVGGRDGENALATVEIYDPATNDVTSAASLATARSGHSATTALDGRVVVIGGKGADGDLASIEIFDGTDWTTSSSSLTTARSGHMAVLLGWNHAILVAGGVAGENALASAELYRPWSGAVVGTGNMTIARNGATAVSLEDEGLLQASGGSGDASAELYGFATVKSDQFEYGPGQTAHITGTGWVPGETVQLHLTEVPKTHDDHNYTAVADANGNISASTYTFELHDIGRKFFMTATGSQSQAQALFKDAPSADIDQCRNGSAASAAN